MPVPMMREDEMANLHEANRCIRRLVSLLLIQRSILINVVPAVQNLNDEGKRGGVDKKLLEKCQRDERGTKTRAGGTIKNPKKRPKTE